MKKRIYKKLCKQATVILVIGFCFSPVDFINDVDGTPYVVIDGCYEPFECSALEMLLQMMEVQTEVDFDVYSLNLNARLIKEAFKFIYTTTPL